MHKIILLFSIFFVLSLKAQNNRPTDESPFILGDLIIQFEKNASPEAVLSQLSNDFEIQLQKELSKPVNIWLAKFNYNAYTHVEVLRALNALPNIKYAQNNHKVYMRDEVFPDDAQYSQQWHHKNTGQTSGTTGADISIENAWDVTTGGLNAFGDEVVVCVIESADLSHPDLVENKWINTAESGFPNGIDTDNNGYVDDYNGWNIQQNNDNIEMMPNGHGTSVAGMIGARGDNGIGVVGANWDVKIMVVAGYSLQEAAVIEAYSYPLTMRQLYNDTNGTEGAFVVATNASWGLDGGDPASAPIWCEFYNTLGEAGILNCGATSNSNLNVDVEGDLPTACASPYMIGVGRSDHNDNFAGGYGLTTIDLAAPGINVRTTGQNDGYTTTSGTSFSSPLTAGVIGLMYSVPCQSFMTIVNTNPQLGADLVRDALLNSVDQLPQLEDFFITGGRLNAEAAIDYLLDNFCNDEDCLPPMNVALENLTDTEADLSWIDFGLEDSWEVHYRIEGTTNWTIEDVTTNTFSISNLTPCSTYEYFIRAICSDVINEDNDIQLFTTDGCCISPSLEEIDVLAYSGDDVEIAWQPILAAVGYNLRYRAEGSDTWILEEDLNELNFSIENLAVCETYEVQIQTICAGNELPEFSESFNFSSAGCDVCSTLSYCDSNGDTTDEWIESFSINNYTNASGDDGGYGSFTGNPIVYLTKGEDANISITPGYSGQVYDEYPRIWIDFNQDGDFTENELVLEPGNSIDETFNDIIQIPSDAINGTTRMRVSMKYFSEGFFPSPPPEACETFTYGEVEDYCVNIGPSCTFNLEGVVNPVGCDGGLGSISLVFDDQTTEDSVSILWDDNSTNNQLTDLEAGMYSVSIMNDDGCIENLSFEVTTAETPIANFEFSQEDNLVNFVNLTENDEDVTYSWDFGNGSTSTEANPNLFFTETGTYLVCLTVNNLCGTTSFCEEVEISTLSLNRFENNQMRLYPNPVEKEVHFNFISEQIEEVQLFDMTGKRLKKVNVLNQSLQMNLGSLDAGVYFVVGLNKNNQIISAKKIIKK
jgi:PKD repeat protein